MFATSESWFSWCSSWLVLILRIPCSTIGSRIFLNIPLHTFSLAISLSVIGHISLPYTTTDFIIFLYIQWGNGGGGFPGLMWPCHDTNLPRKCSAESWETKELYLHKKAKACGRIHCRSLGRSEGFSFCVQDCEVALQTDYVMNTTEHSEVTLPVICKNLCIFHKKSHRTVWRLCRPG